MSMLNNSLLLGAPASGGYQIQRSLRFNSSDSAYLSRVPSTAGNRKTYTLSFWVKRSALTGDNCVFNVSNPGNSEYAYLAFDTNSQLVGEAYAGTLQFSFVTTQRFRDPSAWYHFVLSVDTTNATASSRVRLYVNGSQVTAFSSQTNPTQNLDTVVNATYAHRFGSLYGTNWFYNGYLADIHFIDGQALTPSSFTEVSATTGQLIPKQYTGSFGTNGFWLKFSDNSAATATTLGKDYSGNNNNWSPTNLSVTAGAGNDSLVDTPTSAGTDTGVGGEVVGNYCTLNPLAKTAATTTLSNGNLEATGDRNSYGTFAIPSSGKWYWEVTPTAGFPMIGVTAYVPTSTAAYNDAGLLYAAFNGDKWVNGTNTSYGASYTSNDVVGVAVNVDAGTVTFYKNNTSQGSITYAAAGLFPASTTGGGSATLTFNFGQRPFAYTAPSGFKALCDTNLPAPVVAKPNTVMNVVTGNFDTTKTWTVGFNPDLIWIKSRSNADGHVITDSVRGTNSQLQSNTTGAELTNTTAVTSFNSDGFTIGSYGLVSNTSTVAWCWDAGSSTVTNTQGSITSQVRANASAGFSIVTYTGNGNTTATVGHGLGVTPALVIVKSRSTSGEWPVWFTGFSASEYMYLHSTLAKTSYTPTWGSTPTSSVFGVTGGSSINNNNGTTYVAYCFAPVNSYSAFGAYQGNGSTDGPFVFTGMRPRWIMIKKSSAASAVGWYIYDSSRDTYNLTKNFLAANSSAAEVAAGDGIDILSNGFKLRATGTDINDSGQTFVWAAFAESPFQYARAR